MSKSPFQSVGLVLAIFVGLTFMAPGEAEARKKRGFIPFLINTGEVIHRVADLPAELASDPNLEGWQLGYKCSHFGILFADIWSWDEELVAFKDDTYADLPEDLKAELEEQYSFGDAERNPWQRYGIVMLLALVGGGTLMKLRE